MIKIFIVMMHFKTTIGDNENRSLTKEEEEIKKQSKGLIRLKN